ncbi:hypothetical protein C8R46DRAFT_1050314 [Mycena filopes]|nr:hypothetical protein C8R46DRAFT_1050314 [Mycena filopes]
MDNREFTCAHSRAQAKRRLNIPQSCETGSHEISEDSNGMSDQGRTEGRPIAPTTMNRARVEEDNEDSLEWIGVNKTCLAIPEEAMLRIDDLHHQEDGCAVDEYGRYRSIEHDAQWRGFIPLRRTGDFRRGAWARQTKSRMPVDVGANGCWTLAENSATTVSSDILHFRELVEEICGSELFDEETGAPAIFDVDRIHDSFASELEVHTMVADAHRSLLDAMGFICWWMSSVKTWTKGLTGVIVDHLLNLRLSSDDKRGYLISVNRDWKEANFALWISNKIPFFYVWGMFEQSEQRFTRLDPAVLRHYFEALKLDPCARAVQDLPFLTDLSGSLDYWVIDFQHWGRRRLAEDERVDELNLLYHHIAVQSPSSRTTRVIFHRFHRRPAHKALYDNDTIMEEQLAEPDLCAIRERFKGRCAPRYGQTYDSETGVERKRPIADEDPFEAVAKLEHKTLLLPPDNPTSEPGWHLQAGVPTTKDYQYDGTAYGRSVGRRVTSPDSAHSSERRSYDSSKPMAYAVGWVEAMAREDWSDTVDHYVGNRNGLPPDLRTRGGSARNEFDDARSYFSVSSHSRRSASPERSHRSASPTRSHRVYPIRARTPPAHRRRADRGETVKELADRRAGWLDSFERWGRDATFEASIWRVPPGFSWDSNVLEHGYLIIGRESEFRLRYQVATNPAIRFPRHILEVAMEHGIQFTIGYKKAAADLFKPKPAEYDASRSITKAMVDLRAPGPRLESASSIAPIYRQYRTNVGAIGNRPQARALIMKGGGASWLIRAYLGLSVVRRVMQGPSEQVTKHHSGANDSGDDDCLDLSWDDMSDGDHDAIFGLVRGATTAQDAYLLPTDAILEEHSDHFYREWNFFCEKTFRHLKDELDQGRGSVRTRKE